MNRRQFAGLAAGCAFGAAKRPPNIVLILADDLGYGDLSCYGNTRHRTPNLDRMAQEGVRFTEFYTPMPFCAPTRAALLTGRYPFRSNMTRNPAPDAGMSGFGLPDTEVTLAQALKPLGYATTCIGKWHLGHTAPYLPIRRGFDSYLGILYSNDMRPVQLVENDRVIEYPVAQATLTRRYTERAVRFIEDNRSRPFFLYLPHAMPHKPLAASEDFYTPDTPDDLYSDVVRELDWSVGSILKRLQDLGLDDDTLVVFTSDNGPWYGGSTAGLRGMKARSWDGGIRVPMIARWPGKIAAGRVNKEVCGIIDLFPTVCDASGAPVPSDRVIDGKNILPLMRSADARSPHEALFAMSGGNLAVVRSGKWKLHCRAPQAEPRADRDVSKWVDPRGPDGVTLLAPYEQARPDQYPGVQSGDPPKPFMLFDLESDPSEQHDVAAQNPQVVARMKALFEKLDAQVPRLAPPPKPAGGLRRVKGGELRYDRIPNPPSP
ncbi:MAG: sulfatase-like hydrolase/transferase [Bryobacterales bacterium]|nr:sulfatase-like hydrolase/transferase [Bryobacterales bacterium]